MPSVKALVLDVFCGCAIDAVADELGLPAYMFYPSGACPVAIYLHVPIMPPDVSFRDMGRSLLHFPGMHPLPASDMPEVLLGPRNEQYKATIVLFEQIVKAKGMLANTFEWLEPAAVKAMEDGSPRPGEPLPRLFCIGPLVSEERGGDEGKHECLAWLDTQPVRSVVFLCFGSASSVSAEQLREIAAGLERSGHAFLWAVRAPRRARRRLDEAVRWAQRGGAPGRVPGPDARARAGGVHVGPQVQVLRDRRVRHPLRVELHAGGGHGGRADGVLADVRGAEAEQGAHRGGDEARCGDAGVRRARGHGAGGGSEGPVGHGVWGREGAQGEGGGGEGHGGRRVGERWIVGGGVPGLSEQHRVLDQRLKWSMEQAALLFLAFAVRWAWKLSK
jgi:hypothetical protein